LAAAGKESAGLADLEGGGIAVEPAPAFFEFPEGFA
jgi:hypothetical protein